MHRKYSSIFDEGDVSKYWQQKTIRISAVSFMKQDSILLMIT